MKVIARCSWLIAVLAMVLAAGPVTPAWAAVSGAGFTTFDATVGGCLDSPNGINCNNYSAKEDVYMSGGPTGAAGLSDGEYYFTVLVPGFQNGGFFQGANGNLSDTTQGSTAGDVGSGDDIACRTFSVSDGVITSYLPPSSCAHVTGTSPNGKFIIQLAPYDNTSNPGGVYILAVCRVGATSPSQCKYDAFRAPPSACTADNCPPPPPETLDLTVTKDATPSFKRIFTWGITKSVDKTQINTSTSSATFNYTVTVTHDTGTDSDWGVTGNINITNPNPKTDGTNNASGVTVSDVIKYDPLNNGNLVQDTNASCVVATSGGADPTEGQTVTLTYICTYPNAAPATDSEVNEVDITWQLPASPDKAATFAQGFSFDTPTLVDDCVTVTDTVGGPLGTVCSTDPSPKTFTYSKTVTGTPGTCTSLANTATFKTTTTGTTGSASQTVKECVGADLTVSKTATPSFTRSYSWNIAKNVDKTRVEQIGGTATFNYTVNANETGFTDSAWQVNGTITVSNPNDWEAVTVNVADAVDNNGGGSCAVTGGAGVSVPASSSVTRNYTCTYPLTGPTASSGTNTATATWDSSAAFTPDGSASGTATLAFTTPTTTVNKTVSVTDTFNGVTTTLGTLTATDSTAFASGTYTYSHTVNVPTNNCAFYTNTAKIVETGQTASQTVEVCGPAKTGALTMGFWQNKNGQSIITNDCNLPSAGGLRTYLRGFNPFQDLSSTATCSGIATYVSNVIKAANASGAAMNAMLKGQMLATSLDVYFSNPSQGGNQINAPKPIGLIVIDLTKICKMIDSSTGTATCSSTFENVSSAFGSATSLPVSGMLSFAASQSNVGGTTWYGQVKATQQLAKDAFDAINNGVAFSP